MKKPKKLSLKDNQILSIILLRHHCHISFGIIAEKFRVHKHAILYHCQKFERLNPIGLNTIDYFVAEKVMEDNVLGDRFLFRNDVSRLDGFGDKSKIERIQFITNLMNDETSNKKYINLKRCIIKTRNNVIEEQKGNLKNFGLTYQGSLLDDTVSILD